MKLYSLLENIILEEVGRSEIEDAIEKHVTCRIYYEGDESLSRGWRWIEPYVYGLSLAGNPIIRAYQIEGVTDTEQPGWKTFRSDKISRWVKTPKIFYQPISDRESGVPKYNPNGDRSMTTIYKQARF
jgi:hypothetical protein